MKTSSKNRPQLMGKKGNMFEIGSFKLRYDETN